MDGWSCPGGVMQASIAGGPEPGPGGRSGDSEHTDEDREQDTGAQAQPIGNKVSLPPAPPSLMLEARILIS